MLSGGTVPRAGCSLQGPFYPHTITRNSTSAVDAYQHTTRTLWTLQPQAESAAQRTHEGFSCAARDPCCAHANGCCSPDGGQGHCGGATPQCREAAAETFQDSGSIYVHRETNRSLRGDSGYQRSIRHCLPGDSGLKADSDCI